MGKERRVAFILRGLPGLGHVSPAFAIAEELAERHIEPHFITYSNGVAFLEKNNQKHIQRISTPHHQDGIVPWKEMFEVTTEILPLIKKIMPETVVVDGEFDAFFLLKRLGIKVVMLTTKPYVDHNFSKYTRYSDYAESAMQNADLIIVHGLDRPKAKHDNMIFVGPLVRKIPGRQNRKENVVPICTGFEVNKRLTSFAKLLCKILKREHLVPRLIGGNIAGAEFASEPLEYFLNAPFIVTHGGAATIEEAAVLGKPLMLLCDDDLEKRLNALSAKRNGFGSIIDIRAKPDENVIRMMIKHLAAQSRLPKPVANGTPKAVEAILADN